MGEQEFWDLTFEELDALIDRRRFLDKRTEYLNAEIRCAIFNAQRTDKKQHVFKPEDFMDTGETKAPEAPTRDPIFSALDAFAMARYGINNQGELEARIRIAKEKEEAAEALAASVGADS